MRLPVAVLRWGQGAQAPQILPRLPPPKFLDTVVLLLVELIGSIVISLKFRLAVVASQMMRGQPHPPNILWPRFERSNPQVRRANHYTTKPHNAQYIRRQRVRLLKYVKSQYIHRSISSSDDRKIFWLPVFVLLTIVCNYGFINNIWWRWWWWLSIAICQTVVMRVLVGRDDKVLCPIILATSVVVAGGLS